MTTFGIKAQETQQAKPPSYELKLLWVVDSEPRQFVWYVNGSPDFAFKSLTSENLRKWVADLPDDSTIEYHSNDIRLGGEPSGEEVTQFEAFCKAEKVKFILHPGG